MTVLKSAINISQAFKNVGRVTEIVSVFFSHGFAETLHRMKLSRFVDRIENPRYRDMAPPVRLRLAFEALGPTFVKLGQLLATRSDLIPETYVEELQKLQDHVGTVPFNEIRALIESELGHTLANSFSRFDEVPLGAASIAQVHTARLTTGEEVAVKVQRPGIEKLIQNDVSILRGLAYLLERYVPELRPFNPQGLVEEFFQTIQFELDFRIEANNIRRIRANLASRTKVAIPFVYTAVSSGRLLVLEKFEGVRFSDREAILAAGIDPVSIIEAGADVFFHMVMRDGVFHGDLHAGNLFVLKDGRIGIIDFGIVGRLSRRVQDSIITMFIAIMDEDYETLANEYITLCQSTGDTDILALQKDLMDAISPYVGMSLGEVNAGKILLRSTSIAVRHKLVVPRELMLLFKAIVSIDALGKKLDPNFDVLQLGNRLAREVLSTRYTKERIFRDLVFLGRDVQVILETLPRLSKRFLRRFSQNNFALETRSKDTANLALAVRELGKMIFISTLVLTFFVVGSVLLYLDRGPYIFGAPWGTFLLYTLGTSISLYYAFVLRGK